MFIAAAMSLSLVLSVACTGSEEERPTTTGLPPETPSASAAPPRNRASEAARCRKRAKKAKRFVPNTYREARKVVLPVTFADGSTAELVYPPSLRLAELGVQPTAAVGIQKSRRSVRHERFLLITKQPVDKVTEGSPLHTYDGASGKVTLRRSADEDESLYPLFLHFRIGTWNVLVGDGNAGTFMGPKNREIWAKNLDGHVTENGFVVIEPRPPLAFAVGPGPNLYLATCFRFVDLRLQRCKDLKESKPAKNQSVQTVRGVTVQRNRSRSQFYANWCTPSREISVYLDDRDKRFIDLAVTRLQIRNVDVNESAYYAP